MENNDLYRKIGRNLSKEEIESFESMFQNVPVNENLQAVKLEIVPSMISSSEDLQKKIIFSICASGSLILEDCTGSTVEAGHTICVYRYDKEEENRGGSPVNVDLYKISENSLFKRMPPFPGHKLNYSDILS